MEGPAPDVVVLGGERARVTVDVTHGAEIAEFLAASRQAGAVGASFWVWQEATSDEWSALTSFPWRPRGAGSVPPPVTPKRHPH